MSTSASASEPCAASRTNSASPPARRGPQSIRARPPHRPSVDVQQSELNLLKIRSHGHIPLQFLGDLLPERFGSLGFSVDQKSLSGRLVEFMQPAQNLPVIRMTAQVFQSFNARLDVNVLAVHLDRLTCLDESAARARRLKTHKEDGVAMVRETAFQMMNDAPASSHATRRDNDH